MTTLSEDSIHFFGVTDLAQVQLCVSHFPVADAPAVAFAILEAADILVACRLLNVSTLSMAYVFDPITVV